MYNKKNSKSEKIPSGKNPSNDEEMSFTKSPWFWPSVLSPLVLAFLGGVFFFKKQNDAPKNTPSKGVLTQNSLSKSAKSKAVLSFKSNLEHARNLNNSDQTKEAYQQIEVSLKSLAYLFVNEETTIYSINELNLILTENNVRQKYFYR